MSDLKNRNQRINSKLNLEKLPPKLKKISAEKLGLLVSEFIHHVFIERNKSDSLNWCFANIKRVKIFLQIFHANQLGAEIYKEEIAKNLTEYSYKTIAKIIDEGLSKGYYVLLHPDGDPVKDAKVKNIRPSEQLIVDFLNLYLEVISFIEVKKPK